MNEQQHFFNESLIRNLSQQEKHQYGLSDISADQAELLDVLEAADITTAETLSRKLDCEDYFEWMLKDAIENEVYGIKQDMENSDYLLETYACLIMESPFDEYSTAHIKDMINATTHEERQDDDSLIQAIQEDISNGMFIKLEAEISYSYAVTGSYLFCYPHQDETPFSQELCQHIKRWQDLYPGRNAAWELDNVADSDCGDPDYPYCYRIDSGDYASVLITVEVESLQDFIDNWIEENQEGE